MLLDGSGGAATCCICIPPPKEAPPPIGDCMARSGMPGAGGALLTPSSVTRLTGGGGAMLTGAPKLGDGVPACSGMGGCGEGADADTWE